MDDPELEEIRKRRLEQLSENAPTSKSQAEKEQQEKAKEDAKNTLLSQILDQQARARLNTLMICKPEKGRLVEGMLIRMAQVGQICSKIGEAELISLLENVNKQTQNKENSVKFDRRRVALDSDEDF